MEKQVKLIGKDEDGLYLGRIEQIETAKKFDILDISNRKTNLWVFNMFNGYRQIGQFKVNKPHKYAEQQDVIVNKVDGKIIEVKPNS